MAQDVSATATGFGHNENLGREAVNATTATATCSMSYVMDPGCYGPENAQAGAWQTYLEISSKDHDGVTRNNQDEFFVRRYAELALGGPSVSTGHPAQGRRKHRILPTQHPTAEPHSIRRSQSDSRTHEPPSEDRATEIGSSKSRSVAQP
ncbi:hypothetical protein OHB54_39750 [Streptomyces sp. NBC_01007]|nr:hypothetical protein OHB54_39750 [Streptomyces sp. NBC_01007]